MLKGIRANIQKKLEYKKEYKELCESAEQRFSKSAGMRRTETYINYCESLDVDRNTILYESFWGRGMTDSPFALFKALFHDDRFAEATHVWVVDDLQRRDCKVEKYIKENNVLFVERLSDEYLKYIATAGILVNNVTFPPVFNKRPGQTYINTWHGTPLKKMGYSMAGGSYGSRHVVRNFLHADFCIAPNDILERMYLTDYKMDGIMPGKIIKEGYPRIDLMFNTDREALLDELDYYGVDIDKEKQIILYAPTWKQNDRQDIVVDIDELITFKTTLEENIDTDRYQVLVKPHQKLYERVKDDEKYRGMLVPAAVDANELLSAVDILISDYSSIFYDYMAIDRPILFYITDVEEYSASRGLSMDIDDLPGPVSDDPLVIAGNICNIDKVAEQYRQRYDAVKKQICPYDDGRASERIVDCISGNEERYNIVTTDSARKRMLISLGPLKENGISDSLFCLLKQIDHSKFDVTLYTSLDKADDDLLERLCNDTDPHVRVLLKTGNRAETSAEAGARMFYERNAADDPELQDRFPEEMFMREYKRSFGGAEFDYVVDFNGSNMYNARLMLQGGRARKSICAHNSSKADKEAGKDVKKKMSKSLKYCMSLYPKYDVVVDCGEKGTEEFGRTKASADEFIRAVTGQ